MINTYGLAIIRIIRTRTTSPERKHFYRRLDMTKAVLWGCMDPRAKDGHHKAIKDHSCTNHTYMHLRAGGAGTLGIVGKIMADITLAKPDLLILSVHEDCAKCRNVHKRTRNLKWNLWRIKRKIKKLKLDVRVVGLLVTHDGKYHKV